MQSIGKFSINIQLLLTEGSIAHAHRRCSLVSGQPGHLPFGQVPLSGDSVHDLHLCGAARDGPQ